MSVRGWLIIAALLVAQSLVSPVLAVIDALAIAALHLVDRSWGPP